MCEKNSFILHTQLSVITRFCSLISLKSDYGLLYKADLDSQPDFQNKRTLDLLKTGF